MARTGKRFTLWLTEDMTDYIESNRYEWETSTNYLRRMLYDRMREPDAEKPRPKREKPAKRAQDDTPEATWQDTRDRVTTYLLGLGEREYLAGLTLHHDTPDDFWQEFHAKGTIRNFIEQMEAWEADNKKPAEAG